MDQKYRDMVDENLKTNSSEIFGNFSPEHAGYIIAQFIRSAQKSIEILSGNFSDAFYNGISITELLTSAAKRISQNGGKIRIITVNGKCCEKLRDLERGINTNTPDVMKYVPAKCSNPAEVNHFMVVDGFRSRLEEPHPVPEGDMIPQCVKAEVCCNGVQKSSELSASFRKAWECLTGEAIEQNA